MLRLKTNKTTERENRKWDAIMAISAMSDKYGDLEIALMERHGAKNTREITMEQAEAFLAEITGGGAACPGGCLRSFANPAPHCVVCHFRQTGRQEGGAGHGGLSPAT